MTTELQLTEREILIAKHAADLAVKQMMDNFYKEVGRTFVNKVFIVIGIVVVAFSVGRGWINPINFLGK